MKQTPWTFTSKGARLLQSVTNRAKPYGAHHRCNAPAYVCATNNGYLACRDHAEDGMVLCSELGPAPYGRCDKPLREQ